MNDVDLIEFTNALLDYQDSKELNIEVVDKMGTSRIFDSFSVETMDGVVYLKVKL